MTASKLAIYGAIAANVAIAATKLVVAKRMLARGVVPNDIDALLREALE